MLMTFFYYLYESHFAKRIERKKNYYLKHPDRIVAALDGLPQASVNYRGAMEALEELKRRGRFSSDS